MKKIIRKEAKRTGMGDFKKGLLIGSGGMLLLVGSVSLVRSAIIQQADINKISTLMKSKKDGTFVSTKQKCEMTRFGNPRMTITGIVSKEMADLDDREMYFVTTNDGKKYAIEKVAYPYAGSANGGIAGAGSVNSSDYISCWGNNTKDDEMLSKYLGKKISLSNAMVKERIAWTHPNSTTNRGNNSVLPQETPKSSPKTTTLRQRQVISSPVATPIATVAPSVTTVGAVTSYYVVTVKESDIKIVE